MESFANSEKPNYKKQYSECIKKGHIYHPDDHDGIRNVIATIEKPYEKRSDKERQMLVNMLNELNFFKFRKPMNNDELIEVTNFMGYTCVESGQYLFK